MKFEFTSVSQVVFKTCLTKYAFETIIQPTPNKLELCFVVYLLGSRLNIYTFTWTCGEEDNPRAIARNKSS